MTPQEIRLALAEWGDQHKVCFMNCEGSWMMMGQDRFFDPCNDLNAVHLLEMKLMDKSLLNPYLNELVAVCQVNGTSSIWNTVHATALQRSQALVKVLELDKENKPNE